ncbi:FG-GAP repeat domain-containing protein [candidate division KSB1 bacterium]
MNSKNHSLSILLFFVFTILIIFTGSFYSPDENYIIFDTVCSNMGEIYSKIWLNNGSGYFTDSGQNLTQWGHGVEIEDIDNDGDLDIFAATFIDVPNEIWFNRTY